MWKALLEVDQPGQYEFEIELKIVFCNDPYMRFLDLSSDDWRDLLRESRCGQITTKLTAASLVVNGNDPRILRQGIDAATETQLREQTSVRRWRSGPTDGPGVGSMIERGNGTGTIIEWVTADNRTCPVFVLRTESGARIRQIERRRKPPMRDSTVQQAVLQYLMRARESDIA